MTSTRNPLRLSLLGTLLLGANSIADAQNIHMRGADWDCQIATDGHIERIVYKGKAGNDTIPFFIGRGKPGPAFYMNNGTDDVVATWHPDGELTFLSTIDGISCELRYVKWHGMTNLHCYLRHAQKIAFRGETKSLEGGYLGWAFGHDEYKFD